MSFTPLATGAVVISACVLNAVAVLLTLGGLDQRTQKGKLGALMIAAGVTLLLGFDFAVYPLVTIVQGVKAGTAGSLTALWIAFLPISLLLIGVGASYRRAGVPLRRKRR